MKNHLKFNLLYLLIFIITILGCGSDMNTSSNDTGSATFSLKWENPQNPDNMSLRALSLPKGEAISELSYAPIDCTVLGVSTVSANVYDSGGTYITSGGPWNCADHSGTITGISAGINRMITINGKDSSNRIIYNGQITGVTIDKDQTTNAGQVTMTYVANDTTAPTDGTLSASAGNSQVSLSWSGFSDSGSGIGSYKLVYSNTTTPSSCNSGTQIFTGTGTSYTHTGLANSTTYYYRICATDNAGNTSSGATTSGTPASSGGTSTGTAPSAPTGVSASAGNGQVTISWSSVSGATSYNIHWSTSTGVTKTTGTKITGATSPYTHTGRTNGTTYYYVVTAVGTYGEGSESSQVSAAPVMRTVKALVVAGGGSGGTWSSGTNGNGSPGGGGAGVHLYDDAFPANVQAYSVTVGEGGNTYGANGNNSIFSTMIAIGGGGGGNYNHSGGSGTSGQGNSGGNSSGTLTGSGGAGSGAGSSGGIGTISDYQYGGNGGIGLANSITGSSVYYAGGGGGGDAPGRGGQNGTPNTGGGAGAGATNGGSGIVIISYITGSMTATGGTITTNGAYTVHTFTSSGTFTVTAIF